MPRTTSSDVDLSHDDLVQMIRRAEIARLEFLAENSGIALRMIGWSALAFGLALLVVTGFGPSPPRILENTTHMEWLAMKLGPMEKIAPGTVGQIAELLRRPDYDCREVRCDTALEKRDAAHASNWNGSWRTILFPPRWPQVPPILRDRPRPGSQRRRHLTT